MGDHNLLPHQEDLLRLIVEGYRNNICEQEFYVIDHGDTSDVLEEDCTIEFTLDQRKTLVADLRQISNVGLLQISNVTRDGAKYQITKKSLDTVDNNFRIASSTPVLTDSFIPMLDFSFVRSSEHRRIIERDYDDVQKCLRVGAYKPALVLCGSIIEAILLEQLIADEPKAKLSAAKLKTRHKNQPLHEWELHELVEVATDVGILDNDANTLAHQLRDYRNVIHPGLEIRKNFGPSDGKAHAAVALLKLIIDKL